MASASLTNTMMISTPSRWFSMRRCNNQAFFHHNGTAVNMKKPRWLLSCNTQWRGLQHVSKPISALGSGLEVSITDPEELISLKDATIVVESQDESKIQYSRLVWEIIKVDANSKQVLLRAFMIRYKKIFEASYQVRVDLTGDETQKVFDKVLTNLARSAPPIPGFRREKGGKTSKVPKSLLLQVIGEERVMKFVVQEIVSSTMTDYTKKAMKDKKINTIQTAQELRKLFTPGKDFGFNAVMELEKSEAETSSTSSSDT
ncbi:hypothetical protein JRO89_XS03G0031200 [Xanthoceras sorbifolium]|uniref:Trigger factor ribosome-binding bacterial domain-containing protein n=1 Tax=Xanthoceras sorbifolium TaxID=99658 RepID=A0ABQ8I8D1_9ROSI|nr:hypothetical protein JRO89_XS03G0031200 [Xanthoceras sorbifolium]